MSDKQQPELVADIEISEEGFTFFDNARLDCRCTVVALSVFSSLKLWVPQGSMGFPFSPADIVLSCTICQETLSTIYAHDDRNDGLRKDGEGPSSGKITKLWLTECAHLTCGKHLPGGGAPFHSVDEVPRAPCPLCSMEKDDHSDKALFFIHGTSKGQYDENIPDTYVHVPPAQLSDGYPGLEALRFQYLSLLRSGSKTREKVNGLAKALKRWEDKKPEIVRSLSSVAPLRDALLSAGRRLMALGEDVSSIEATLQLAGISLTEGFRDQQQTDVRFQSLKKDLAAEGRSFSPLNGGSRLAQGSAADLDSLNQGVRNNRSHNETPLQDPVQLDRSSSKRKRIDSTSDTELQTEHASHGGAFENCRSRDQMPPPPIPIQQPFAYQARIPSLHWQNPKFHHDATHLPVTPQRHPSGGRFSRSILAPESSMEPSNGLPVATRTNNKQSHVDHYQPPPLVDTGTAGPLYVRGGWQRAPRSFETEGSGYFSSPDSSLPSTTKPPVRCLTKYHQGSLTLPIELENRKIDPSSHSYHSASSEGFLSYHGRQPVPAMQAQLESPTYSGNHNPSPKREGRITLPRTPSIVNRHSTNKSMGLFTRVRSSSRQINHHLAASSTDRPQLVSTPAHQRPSSSAWSSAGHMSYSSSLPSLDGPGTQSSGRNNFFDAGLTPANCEMRPFSSSNNEFVLLSHENHETQKRDRGYLMDLQASRPRRRANR